MNEVIPAELLLVARHAPAPVTMSSATVPENRSPSASYIRVLLVEDSDSDALLIEAGLRDCYTAKFHVTRLDRCATAVRLFETQDFDVVLCDLGLPDSRGLDTLSAVHAAAPDVPIIVLTGNDDEYLGLATLKRGAHDYLIKQQVTGSIIGRAIRYTIERRALEENLRQSKKLEAVGQLAGGVAHDFNNILTIIQGNVALGLEAANVPTEVADAMREINAAAEKAANLTRQLLAFSRRQPMRREPIDLGEVVSPMMRMLERVLGEQIQIKLDLTPGLPSIFADRGMVEQVLMNLTVNARDAMPAGGTLTVSSRLATFEECGLKTELVGERFVQLSIRDTGCGISDENISRVFEPFFTTKDIGKGTGLGLATVHGIVHQHAGCIRVQSTPGKGTAFDTFWRTSTEAQGATRKSALPVSTIRGHGEMVLVVEDETAVQQLILMLLNRHGFSVLAASNGREGIEKWLQHKDRIAVIITDVVMPGGISGVEMIRTMRRGHECPPVIFTTGYSRDLVVADGALAETDALLTKPYNLPDLLSAVQTALRRKALR